MSSKLTVSLHSGTESAMRNASEPWIAARVQPSTPDCSDFHTRQPSGASFVRNPAVSSVASVTGVAPPEEWLASITEKLPIILFAAVSK